jgi:hypothetical protein
MMNIHQAYNNTSPHYSKVPDEPYDLQLIQLGSMQICPKLVKVILDALLFSFLSTVHPCVDQSTHLLQPTSSASLLHQPTDTRLNVARGLVGYGYPRAHHRPGPTRPGPTADKEQGRPGAGPPSTHVTTDKVNGDLTRTPRQGFRPEI